MSTAHHFHAVCVVTYPFRRAAVVITCALRGHVWGGPYRAAGCIDGCDYCTRCGMTTHADEADLVKPALPDLLEHRP